MLRSYDMDSDIETKLYNVPHYTTGISKLLEDNPEVADQAVYEDPNEPLCRKDTGKAKRLRKWSRGHQFIVRAGGHIDTWHPLYKYVN